MWVIGGFEPRGSEIFGVASARVLHLNQAQTAWVDAPALHHARGAGAAAVVGNKIVVVGGRTAGTSPAEVVPTEIFDGTSWHDAAAFRFRAITWRPCRTVRTCTPSAGAG